MADDKVALEAKEVQQFTKFELETRSVINSLVGFNGNRNELSGVTHLVRQRLRDLRNALKKIQHLRDDLAFNSKQNEIKELVCKYQATIVEMEAAFRQSFVAAEQRLSGTEGRELIPEMEDSNEGNNLRYRNKNKANAAQNSSKITEQLMGIARLMNAQVEQSSESNQILEKSSAKVDETHHEYKGLTGLIQSSRNLLNKYDRRSLTDSLLIILGVVFFMLTVVYIVSKRI